MLSNPWCKGQVHTVSNLSITENVFCNIFLIWYSIRSKRLQSIFSAIDSPILFVIRHLHQRKPRLSAFTKMKHSDADKKYLVSKRPSLLTKSTTSRKKDKHNIMITTVLIIKAIKIIKIIIIMIIKITIKILTTILIITKLMITTKVFRSSTKLSWSLFNI